MADGLQFLSQGGLRQITEPLLLHIGKIGFDLRGIRNGKRAVPTETSSDQPLASSNRARSLSARALCRLMFRAATVDVGLIECVQKPVRESNTAQTSPFPMPCHRSPRIREEEHLDSGTQGAGGSFSSLNAP